MTYQFTGNLKGNSEHIFRQSVMGGIGHIVTNYEDFLGWFIDLYNDDVPAYEMRIETWCGRNYKYNEKYSSMDGRNGVVRNACEYCFTEYDPDEWTEERSKQKAIQVREANSRSSRNDLPF